MEKVVHVLKPKPKPQELLRNWQRNVREARGIQREEKNVEESSNYAFKINDVGSTKMFMDADAKDIQSDLYALKKLYRLLKRNGDETSNTPSDLLDDHARLLLKNLLDAAAKKALKLHAEMIAGQVEASEILSPPDYSSKETQHGQIRKYVIEDSDRDKKLNNLDVTVEQSEQSLVGNGPEYKSKHCRVCRRDTLKRIDSMEEEIFYDVEAQDSNGFFDQSSETGALLSNNTGESKTGNESQKEPFSSNSNHTKYTDISSDRRVSDFDEVCNYDIEAKNKPDEVDRVSEEASQVIKQIELCISAFQIGSDHLHLFEGDSAQRQNWVVETKLVSPALQTQYGAVSRAEMSQCESSFQDRVGYLQHQVPCPTTEEINLPLFSSSQPSKTVQPSNAMWRQSAYHFIRNRGPALGSYGLGELGESIEKHKFPVRKANNFLGQNVKIIQDKMSRNETSNGTPNWPAIIDSVSRMESPYQRQRAIEDENNNHIHFRPSDSVMYLNNSENAQSVDSGLNVALTSRVPKKHPPKLLASPGFHENQSYAKHKDGNPKNRQHNMNATGKFIQHQESEGTSTDSYSSNSRSQENSIRNSDSKEYSSSGQTNSESWASPLSQQSESSYTSNSENEGYSSTPSGSSKSDANSIYNQPIKRRAGPTFSMARKSGNEVKHKKQSGTWKRLKDGLAIIFHHHHHHHHHHNQDDRVSKMKNKGKNINFKSEDETYGERAVEKVGKALIRDKNQKVHFHGLMGGLLRHVRRSKKSKEGKETIDQLAKGHHRKKKTMKKSQWWKLLQHQRGARKAHLKLGLGKKRNRLKALPMLK